MNRIQYFLMCLIALAAFALAGCGAAPEENSASVSEALSVAITIPVKPGTLCITGSNIVRLYQDPANPAWDARLRYVNLQRSISASGYYTTQFNYANAITPTADYNAACATLALGGSRQVTITYDPSTCDVQGTCQLVGKADVF